MTRDQPPRPDLGALWRGQPEEHPPMDLDAVRRKAKSFERRKRLANAVEYIAGGLVILIFGLYVFVLPGISLKIGSAGGVLWALVYIWQRRRLMSARAAPDDAAACLDFYRRELERQRDAVRAAWRWMLAPLAPIMVMFILGRLIEAPSFGRPVWLDRLIIGVSAVLIIETLVLSALWLRRRADRLQDQLDELDRLGRQPS